MNKFDAIRKRKHRITIRLNDDEYERLCEWSTSCRMSMNDYIRGLIKGFQPIAFPPIEYREVLSELRQIGINVNQIASKAHSLGFIDAPEYEKNAERLSKTIVELSTPLRKGWVKFGSNKNMGSEQ